MVNIAIDGPAGAGKSTISKEVAKSLGYIYIDTGAMYRAVALNAIRQGIDITADVDKVIETLDGISIDIKHKDDGQQLIFLNGEDVSDMIRTLAVSKGASNVAVIPKVRLKLVELQRKLAQNNDVIMDGRDIGTYVLPNATVKIFLTATAEDRARRRHEELLEKGQPCDFCEVLKDVNYRDNNDSSREFAPLKPAEDSIILDTTGNELGDSIELVISTIRKRLT